MGCFYTFERYSMAGKLLKLDTVFKKYLTPNLTPITFK